MFKGFIDFNGTAIPFVLDNYTLEIFSNSDAASDFCKKYNHKTNYILNGTIDGGLQDQFSREIIALVEYSMGRTCYLICFTISDIGKSTLPCTYISFQSDLLDNIFRFKYNFVDYTRDGKNFGAKPTDIYHIPFQINGEPYELTYRIGLDHNLGLLNDFEKTGEAFISLKKGDLLECLKLTVLIERFTKFMCSCPNFESKSILLYRSSLRYGRFFYKFEKPETHDYLDTRFYDYDVNKYTSKILNNIAIDLGSEVTRSIPLGHLTEFDRFYSPYHFIELVTSFEYLFDKLEHSKSKDRKFTLKDELELMINKYPDFIKSTKDTANSIANTIKEIRRKIVHGYTYFYDFSVDFKKMMLVSLLHNLVKAMSLQLIGLTYEEIIECKSVFHLY